VFGVTNVWLRLLYALTINLMCVITEKNGFVKLSTIRDDVEMVVKREIYLFLSLMVHERVWWGGTEFYEQ